MATNGSAIFKVPCPVAMVEEDLSTDAKVLYQRNRRGMCSF